jgi:hypothetical protein
MDSLDCVCCASILLHVIATLFFNNATLSPHGAQQLELALLICNLLTILAILSLFTVMLVEHQFKASSVHLLSRSVARYVSALRDELQCHREEFARLLDEARVSHPRGMDVGMLVAHATHKRGVITHIRKNNVTVRFHSGASHHYTLDTAAQRLQLIARSADDAVLLKQFLVAAMKCLLGSGSGVVVTELGLEALFVIIRASGSAESHSGASTMPALQLGDEFDDGVHSYSDASAIASLELVEREICGARQFELSRAVVRLAAVHSRRPRE